jgi:integrase
MTSSRSGTRGSIAAKGPDRWLVRVQLGKDQNGKRVREHKVIRGTRREAQRHLTALLAAKDLGKRPRSHRLTVGEWVREWLADHMQSRGPRTRRDYAQVFRRMFEFWPSLGGLQLTELDSDHVKHLLSVIASAKKRRQVKGKPGRVESDDLLSPRSIRIYHGALRALLNDAIRAKKIQQNAASLVRVPSLARIPRPFLTTEQAERLMSISKDDRFHALFATLILAALRPGEAFALRWSDLEGKALRVQRSLVWLPGSPPFFAPTKTGRARNVLIWDRLIAILKRHRTQQLEMRLKMGATYVDQDLIFATETGGPLQLRNVVARHFKPLLRRADIPGARLYDLRHCHASMLLEQGEHPKVVQERLGHSSITLTLDTYSHVMPGLQERAAERLDAHLASARAKLGT